MPERLMCRRGWPSAVIAAGLLVSAGCSSGSNSHSSGSAAASPQVASSTGSASPTPLPSGVIRSINMPTASAPFGVTAGFGSIWVPTHRGSDILRVNPKNNRVLADISVDDCCVLPFAADGRLWAGNKVIDPRSNQVVHSVDDVNALFAEVDGLVWGVSSVFVAMDPATYRPIRTFKVDANPRRVSDPDIEPVYGDGAFWVINVGDETGTFGGVVVKFDPRTGKVLHTYRPPDPGLGADIHFLDHAIWLKGYDSGRLIKLDTRTGATRVYRLPGFQPLTSLYSMTIADGYGDLWIRISTDKVVRFRPSTGRVVGTYPASPTGNGGQTWVAYGSLWVANFDDDTVWRDRITSS